MRGSDKGNDPYLSRWYSEIVGRLASLQLIEKNRGTRPRVHRDDFAAGRSTCCNIVALADRLKAIAPKADTSYQDASK
jgi:hypothetical protein